jgi:hypothetical protein
MHLFSLSETTGILNTDKFIATDYDNFILKTMIKKKGYDRRYAVFYVLHYLPT